MSLLKYAIVFLFLFAKMNTAIAQEEPQPDEYIPGYLSQDNEFIEQHFEIMDSSGWFIALPESEVAFDNFLNNYKEHFGMGADDGFVLTRTTNDDYPFMGEERKLHTIGTTKPIKV